jgi:hypothetical protein
MLPCITSQPPSARTPIWARPGNASRDAENPAVILAERIRDWKSTFDSAASASCSWASCPNAFTTRTPVTASSTMPATEAL